MAKIEVMGHFTAIGMRTKVEDPNAFVINTCGGNDTADEGTETTWTWCNPTNRAITHHYKDIEAVSVEALWQGCKLLQGQNRPDNDILQGNWRKNKGKKPVGAYAGLGQLLITTPGEARRRIYIPAYKNLINHWTERSQTVCLNIERAHLWNGPVYLRDHDTGRGIDRNGPMSHAWVLAVWLNGGNWPN